MVWIQPLVTSQETEAPINMHCSDRYKGTLIQKPNKIGQGVWLEIRDRRADEMLKASPKPKPGLTSLVRLGIISNVCSIHETGT